MNKSSTISTNSKTPLANFAAAALKNTNNLNAQQKCTYCFSNLGNVSIKCGVCESFFLCLKVNYFHIKRKKRRVYFLY